MPRNTRRNSSFIHSSVGDSPSRNPSRNTPHHNQSSKNETQVNETQVNETQVNETQVNNAFIESRKHGSINELLTRKFVEIMRTNMWQYFNENTIKDVLKHAKCSVNYHKMKKIDTQYKYDEDKDKEKYRNSIVFQGSRDFGHYVYVDPNLNAFGTYECNILYEKDSGFCHGFALAAALSNCEYKKYIGNIFTNPASNIERISNYITIMNTYKLIIEKKWWEEAVYNNFFYNFVTNTEKKKSEKEKDKKKSEMMLIKIVEDKIKKQVTKALGALNELLKNLSILLEFY